MERFGGIFARSECRLARLNNEYRYVLAFLQWGKRGRIDAQLLAP
jgi:hypothetical protein